MARTHILEIRVSAEEREAVLRRAREAGYASVSGYVRDVLNAVAVATGPDGRIPRRVEVAKAPLSLVLDSIVTHGREINEVARSLNATRMWAMRAYREGAFADSSAERLACVVDECAALIGRAATGAREDLEWVMEGMRGATVLWSREKVERRNDGRD